MVEIDLKDVDFDFLISNFDEILKSDIYIPSMVAEVFRYDEKYQDIEKYKRLEEEFKEGWLMERVALKWADEDYYENGNPEFNKFVETVLSADDSLKPLIGV